MKIKKLSIDIDIILTFIFFAFINIIIFFFFCTVFPKFNFDSQIPLTQAFASSSSFLPYKDIYFPYGILFYLKYDNLFFSTIYIFLLPLLLASFLLFFKKLWGKTIYAYISFLAFVYFVIKFSGIDTFVRYGVIAALGLLFSYFFSKKTYIGSVVSLLSGLLIGIIFSLIHDQGIYGIFLYLFFLLINPLIKMGINEVKSRKYYFYLLSGIVFFSGGFFLGFFPFFIYLVYNKILINFFQFLWNLRDFSAYAKTSFIPYSSTSDNLFAFSMLFLSIFFIIYNVFYRKKFSLSFYLILNYVIIIILLEQKSLIRSLDVVITFLAFVLFVGLVYECVMFLKSNRLSDKKTLFCYVILITIILFKLNLHSFAFSAYIPHHVKNGRNNACFSINLDKFLTEEEKYKKVEMSIKKDPRFSGKVFSYLSDPIFYNLFSQKPPYYFTIFEATPYYAQKENIRYIEENNVSHIIYNMDIVALQDGVPDYARGNLLFKYIINNFTIGENIENLLIFEKKNIDSDFFEEKKLELPKFKKYLLNINLGALPKSEGIYKGKNVLRQNDSVLISSDSIFVINEYLEKNTIKTSDKLLILTAKNYKEDVKNTRISFKTSSEKITTVTFYRCNINKPCIINLASIPLFYKERVIKEIKLDNNFDGQIDLLNNRTEFNLW